LVTDLLSLKKVQPFKSPSRHTCSKSKMAIFEEMPRFPPRLSLATDLFTLSMIYLLILLFLSPLKVSATAKSDILKTQIIQQLQKEHHPISYKEANEILFTKLDNHQGTICSVYSKDNCIETTSIPSPKIMNIEHTWPQSLGANGEAKSDLHHIFIVDSPTNSIRSSLPFCDVEVIKWTNGSSKRGMSKFNEHCFEPPLDHKGDVARAMFYFSLRYQKSIDEHQEYFLKLWNKLDPVDKNESERNAEIKIFQGNSNPFVENIQLADEVLDFQFNETK